jgi:hypothetical protein
MKLMAIVNPSHFIFIYDLSLECVDLTGMKTLTMKEVNKT